MSKVSKIKTKPHSQVEMVYNGKNQIKTKRYVYINTLYRNWFSYKHVYLKSKHWLFFIWKQWILFMKLYLGFILNLINFVKLGEMFFFFFFFFFFVLGKNLINRIWRISYFIALMYISTIFCLFALKCNLFS